MFTCTLDPLDPHGPIWTLLDPIWQFGPISTHLTHMDLVRFSNWLESQLEERTPSERIIFLQRLLALKMWLVPPHMSHIFGFSGMQGRMLACQNLRKSIQKRARADLVPPPVCQFTESTSFPSYLFQFGKWISLLGDFTFVISTFWWSLNQHQWISSNFILNFLLIFSCQRGDTCYDQLQRGYEFLNDNACSFYYASLNVQCTSSLLIFLKFWTVFVRKSYLYLRTGWF